MNLLIHDLDEEISSDLENKFDKVIRADGKYAPCKGCFICWTKTPASCVMKDSLQEMCRIMGISDDLVIITENWYGGYSPAIKNILDRSIGTSTPFSTYRGRQMHHTLRYGRHNKLKIVVYGDITGEEKKTWQLMAERNALNYGYNSYEVIFTSSKKEVVNI